MPLAVVRLTHESGSPVLSAVTDVSVMLSAELVTLTAGASVVVIVPLEDEVVPVLLARLNAADPASGAMLRPLKVTAPPFVPRLTPAAAEVLEVVLPKFIVPPALVLSTKMPMPVGFAVVVVPIVKLPLTRSMLMPCVGLFVEETLVKLSAIGVAGATALVMLRATPVVAERLPVLLVTVIVPVLSAAIKASPLVLVALRERKVTLPALPLPLMPRFTAAPAVVLLTVVAPKLADVPAARARISIPKPVATIPERLVVPATVLPPAELRKADCPAPVLF